MKFNVGDKVRIKPGAHGYRGRHGNVETITSISPCGNYVRVNGDVTGGVEDQFELVEEGMTELEDLVKKANEVPKLFDQLKNHPEAHKVNFGMKNGSKITLGKLFNSLVPSLIGDYCESDGDVFHINKPVFDPFFVGSSWKVELKDNMTHIGCQKWNSIYLINRLKDLLNGMGKTDKFYATRKGVKFTPDTGSAHEISWEDAEKIVTALEKVGVK